MRRHIRVCSGALALFTLTGSHRVVSGQDRRPKLKFDAAAIHRSAPGVDRYEVSVSPSTLIYSGITLKLLIRTAWRLQDLQVVGGPAWLDSARFDITAKLDHPHPPEEMLAMMRDLVEDRFQLVLTPESRVQSHYSLVPAASKDGKHPGLIRALEEECRPQDVYRSGSSKPGAAPPCGAVRINTAVIPSQYAATSIPMSQLAMSLTGVMNSWIENNTGIEGNYDIRFSWTPDVALSGGANTQGTGANPDATAGPTIFGAVQNELGLKLAPVNGPVPVFVIKRAEPPSDN